MTTPPLSPTDGELAVGVAGSPVAAPPATTITIPPTPTEELAAEIARALVAANLIASSDLSRCTTLLQNTTPDGSDWMFLLENQLTPRPSSDEPNQ